MWQILAVWVESSVLPGNDFMRALRQEFTPARADRLRRHFPSRHHPIRLDDDDVWIVGSELTRETGVYPIVTFRAGGAKDAVADAAFRVSLIRALEGGMEAFGWRFEQAEEYDDADTSASTGDSEDAGSSHPYAHAQAIKGWIKGVNCLVHSHVEGDTCPGFVSGRHHLVDAERARVQGHTLVKHPAFPLGVTTLTGLALAVFTTLYGARRAREVFGGVRKLESSTGELRRDLEILSIFD